ncbi:MAG: hypothetical protein AB1499_18245, partial [Nitrospirota bacterium]
YLYYLQNTGSNSTPVFDSAQKLLLGDGTALRYINTPASSGPRSRFDITDWNEDGYADIIVGGADGKLMLFTAAPEPVSSTLFIIGSGVLAFRNFRRKYK